MRPPVRARRSGYTLLELALAATILALALGSLALFSRRTTSALDEGAAQAEQEAELWRTLRRIGEELLPSGFGVITPQVFAPEGEHELTYRRSEGQINGRIVWGAPRRIALALEAGELDDGLDNDGDGLADESQVQWTLDVGETGERTVVLCHGVRALGRGEQPNGLDDDQDGRVDEPGLAFQREGEAVRLSLTLERPDSGGRPVTQVLETLVQPRN